MCISTSISFLDGNITVISTTAGLLTLALNVPPSPLTFRIDIMKLSGKVGLLYQNKLISDDDLSPVMPCLASAAVNLRAALSVRDASDRRPRDVGEPVMEGYKLLYKVIKPHMQTKNSDKLTRVCEFLGSEEFLGAIMRRGDMEAVRISLGTHVGRLMEVEGLAAANENLRRETMKRRERVKVLVQKPEFRAYMRDAAARGLVSEWIMREGGIEGMSRLEFYCAVLDFKAITSRPILKGRAGVIYEKFVRVGAIKGIGVLNVEDVETMGVTLATEDFVSKGFFDVAVERVVKVMDERFAVGFVESKEYARLVEELEHLELRLHIDVDEHEHEGCGEEHGHGVEESTDERA